MLNNKIVKNKTRVKILGNVLDQNLSWDFQLSNVLIPNLANRVRTLKLTAKFMDKKFRIQYSNAVFRSKLLFGIETWGGCSKSLISKVQLLQDKAARVAYGSRNPNKSDRQVQAELNWLPVVDEIRVATYKGCFQF